MTPARAPAATTATEHVYRGIHDAVTEHRLAPGAWLREEELAAGFGVSRTVVRQALQRLAQDHVVELHPNRGARVPLPDLDDAAHVFEARRVAECEIARRLGGRLDAARVAELQALVDAENAATAAGDAAAAVRLSGEFHLALAAMHGNPVFVRLLRGLLPTTSVLMARFASQGQPVCVAHRHAELLQALARGPREAAAEMKQHLQELERSLAAGAAPATRALRDTFARYREAVDEGGPGG
ncbi:MAG: GntR family transcriptional regulator [Rubrivivax sp.]